MIKILFLTSNPEGTPALKLDEEARLIAQKIRASKYWDVLKLETRWIYIFWRRVEGAALSRPTALCPIHKYFRMSPAYEMPLW